MKRIIYAFGILALSALSFAACQKEQDIKGEPQSGKQVTISFTAEKAGVATRTGIAEEGTSEVSYKWTSEDLNNIKLFTVDGSTLTQVANPTITKVSDDKLTISATVDANATYTFRAILAGAWDGNTPMLSASQTPNSTSKFDPTADILITDDKTVTVGAEGATGDMLLTFRRQVVVNKMTLKNLTAGEKISGVVISSNNNKELASGQTSLTVNYNNEEIPGNGEFVVYFVTTPNTGVSLTVAVTTDKNYYSKTFDDGRSIDFNLGQFTKFNFALPADEPPLTIESLANGNKIIIKNPLGLTIQYQVDSYEIQTISGNVEISVFKGEKVRFWGDNAAYSNGIDASDVHTSISSIGDIKIYGNIMSLIDSDGFSELKELTKPYTFKGLFATDGQYGNQYLTDASGLLLPATTLTAYCYYDMFYDCNQMTAAPALPATTLAESCYENMFKECVHLATAPALPATTLAKRCYANMFKECWDALTAAPALPATTLADNCYESMFIGCSKLTKAPALLAETLAANCYAHMFEKCLVLATAPALPATTLANSCYYSMFLGCEKLETAPVLPAETLEPYCYRSMFSGCNILKSVTCLATDISATSCTAEWLKDVAAEGTFTKSASMNGWAQDSGSGIPSGWTVKDNS